MVGVPDGPHWTCSPLSPDQQWEGAGAKPEGQTTQQSWAVAGMRLEAVCGNSDPLQLTRLITIEDYRKLLTTLPTMCSTLGPCLIPGEGHNLRTNLRPARGQRGQNLE